MRVRLRLGFPQEFLMRNNLSLDTAGWVGWFLNRIFYGSFAEAARTSSAVSNQMRLVYGSDCQVTPARTRFEGFEIGNNIFHFYIFIVRQTASPFSLSCRESFSTAPVVCLNCGSLALGSGP